MKRADFQVGQDVFYPTAGVGVIEAMEEIVVGAEHELCYVIRIPENQIMIKVPKTKALKNGLRPLLEGAEIRDLMRILGEKSGVRQTGHWADHCKDLGRRIQVGEALVVGAAVRDLTRLKANHGLSFEEARLLEVAYGYLTREVAAVEKVTLAAAGDMIRASIAQSS